jgi:magnesium-transporting ATPase (P-type)
MTRRDQMSNLIGSISSIIALLVGVAVWAVLFVVILAVLKKASPFTGWTCYVIAACVSLLSVVAMFRTLGGPASPEQTSRNRDPMGFILLPYEAMGIAMLLVLFLLFMRRLTRIGTAGTLRRKCQLGKTSKQEQLFKDPIVPRLPGRGRQD